MAKWSNYLIGLRIVTLTSIAVTGLVLGIRQLRFLEALELKTFDQLMRQRPFETRDLRLLVVTVTEEDIRHQGNEPRRGLLSDRSLARLLATLESYKPRAIGLDILRDFPVEAKYPDLAKRLKESNRLFTICRVSGGTDNPGVAPPPEVPKERQGFIDVVIDPDGILRRHLLAIDPASQSPCQASYAFSFLIADHYLRAEGISTKFTSEGELQVGTTVLKHLEPHSGGYQGIDSGGYQVLLNYRATQNSVQQVTLTDVLTERVNPNVVRDRLVLIGYTALSVEDDVNTPYGEMPGVIIQAQMVSQILSAVLDGRPLLWVWSWWGEVLWIWGWSLVGGTIFWLFRPRLSLGLAGGAAPVTLYAICFLLLVQGGWIPLVPSALALLATGGAVVIGFTFYVCPLLSRRIQEPRRLDLPYPDKNKLTQDPFPALQDWLGEIERTAPSRRFLLCLDEFERLSEVVEATGSRTPLNFLRNVLQHNTSWTLLFSGSHEPRELPDYWSDYLINTRTLRVSYLDEDSARELIVQPVEDFTNIYDRTAIDTIIHLTRCQPYLVQLTCYEVVELLNRDIRENR